MRNGYENDIYKKLTIRLDEQAYEELEELQKYFADNQFSSSKSAVITFLR